MVRVLEMLLLFSLIAITTTGCADKALEYYNLGVEAAAREDMDEAIRLWERSLEIRPGDFEANYNLGMALIARERFDQARQRLLRAVELAPDDREAWHGLGLSEEALGDLSAATRSYTRSKNIDPDFAPAIRGLASVSIKKGQYKTALEHAKLAFNIEPRNIEGNILLADAYFHNGNYTESYAQAVSTRRFAPTNQRLLFSLGRAAYARRMLRDALPILQDAKAAGFSEPELYLYLGLTNLGLERYGDAVTDFKLAIYKDGSSIDPWRGLGDAYARLKNWEEAFTAYRRALELVPEDPESRLGIGIAYLHAGRFDEALDNLEFLARSDGTPPRTFYYLGHTLLRLDRREDALRAFERFLEIWRGDEQLEREVRSIMEKLSS